jgi:hypothetical protein
MLEMEWFRVMFSCNGAIIMFGYTVLDALLNNEIAIGVAGQICRIAISF